MNSVVLIDIIKNIQNNIENNKYKLLEIGFIEDIEFPPSYTITFDEFQMFFMKNKYGNSELIYIDNDYKVYLILFYGEFLVNSLNFKNIGTTKYPSNPLDKYYSLSRKDVSIILYSKSTRQTLYITNNDN